MLTKCVSCEKEISSLADKCPNCGHPNKWVHPLVEKFKRENDKGFDVDQFVFTAGKNWIKGETGEHPDNMKSETNKKSITIGLLIGSFISGVAGFPQGLVAILVLATIIWCCYRYFFDARNAHEFLATIDDEELKWTSDDDVYWKPIKDYLESEYSRV